MMIEEAGEWTPVTFVSNNNNINTTHHLLLSELSYFSASYHMDKPASQHCHCRIHGFL